MQFCGKTTGLFMERSCRHRNFYNFAQNPNHSITFVTSTPNAIAFHQNNQGTFLVSGHYDHSVRYWVVIKKDLQLYLQLLWSTHQNALLSTKACIEGVQDLSNSNRDLLVQRGAIKKQLIFSDIAKVASGQKAEGSNSSNNQNSSSANDNGNYDVNNNEKKCVIF